MLNSILSAIPPIHPEGHRYIGIFAFVMLIGFWIWSPLGWVLLAATIWCALFFRDPQRVTPLDAALIIAPADGVISFIGRAAPPAALKMGDGPFVRISVFMNVFNCHVNRSPIEGHIETLAYEPGLFLNAELDKASESNERSGLVIARDDGTRIAVVQIAGLVARRIVSFVREGGSLTAGERFGLIRFGSRVDTYVPEGTPILVAVGQTSVAGETVLAELGTRATDHVVRAS